jgi:undecaprenyl-diphosphatase
LGAKALVDSVIAHPAGASLRAASITSVYHLRVCTTVHGEREELAGAPGLAITSARRRLAGPMLRVFDEGVDRWVERHRHRSLDPLFYGLSSAADHALLWLLVGALRSAVTGDPARGLRLGGALAVESALTNGPIKACFRRIRPPQPIAGPLPYGMHRPITSAFPSGHATSAFTAATLLSEGTRLGPMWFALAALVAASRVYVRLHHASDVLAGAALGLALGQALRQIPALRVRPE